MKLPIKIGATAAGVGLAITAMTGAFGGWTSSDATEQAVQAGVVDMSLASSTMTTAFGTTSAPLAPGDTGYRVVTLTNSADNAIDLANVKVYVAMGEITDTVSPAAVKADLEADISIKVESCSVAWSSGACSGTTTTIQDTAALSTYDGSGNAQTLFSSIAKNASKYLKFSYSVANNASITSAAQGASTTVTWTFTADPRSAVTTA